MLQLPLGWGLIKVQSGTSFTTRCRSHWKDIIRNVDGQDETADLLSAFCSTYIVIQAG